MKSKMQLQNMFLVQDQKRFLHPLLTYLILCYSCSSMHVCDMMEYQVKSYPLLNWILFHMLVLLWLLLMNVDMNCSLHFEMLVFTVFAKEWILSITPPSTPPIWYMHFTYNWLMLGWKPVDSLLRFFWGVLQYWELYRWCTVLIFMWMFQNNCSMAVVYVGVISKLIFYLGAFLFLEYCIYAEFLLWKFLLLVRFLESA